MIRFKSQLVRHLTTLAEVVADNSSAPLAFDNKQTAEEVLQALKVEPNIVAAVLYDQQGKLFAKYPPALPAELLPKQLKGKHHAFTGGALVLFEPVTQEQKVVGTLYLRTSLEGLHQQLRRYGTIVAIVFAASLAAAFVLSTLLQKRITDPILSLTRAAQAISQHPKGECRLNKDCPLFRSGGI